jgi:hypothetical protein
MLSAGLQEHDMSYTSVSACESSRYTVIGKFKAKANMCAVGGQHRRQLQGLLKTIWSKHVVAGAKQAVPGKMVLPCMNLTGDDVAVKAVNMSSMFTAVPYVDPTRFGGSRQGAHA